ncbi:MAG: glycine cleavage system protein H [Candidatus Bathyarchaeota archaeon]|nr:glycine cleavage system protein H [Candidatus Bathyarchaeota archaeon]
MVVLDGYEFPEDLYYTPEDGVGNSWARIEADGSVTVGIDDFFQKTTKSIRYIDLPFEGDKVAQGKAVATVESEKWVGQGTAPVSGEVLAVNNKVLEQPKLVNKDPYGEGWLVKIKPEKLDKEIKNLVHGLEGIKQLYRKSVEKYLKR